MYLNLNALQDKKNRLYIMTALPQTTVELSSERRDGHTGSAGSAVQLCSTCNGGVHTHTPQA